MHLHHTPAYIHTTHQPSHTPTLLHVYSPQNPYNTPTLLQVYSPQRHTLMQTTSIFTHQPPPDNVHSSQSSYIPLTITTCTQPNVHTHHIHSHSLVPRPSNHSWMDYITATMKVVKSWPMGSYGIGISTLQSNCSHMHESQRLNTDVDAVLLVALILGYQSVSSEQWLLT